MLKHASDDCGRRWVLQIECQAFFGAVEPDMMGRYSTHSFFLATREVAHAGPLNLDDPRAEIGELARRKRRRDGLL